MKKELSLRRIHVALIIVLMVTSATVVIYTFYLTNFFLRFTSAYKESMELQDAARELMDASDYLTEQVQRFTISGDVRFLNQYFTEAFETNRREEAVAKMAAGSGTDAAVAQLQSAMESSVKLMDQEYYAMRLVIEAKGYTDYPDVLDTVELSPEDAALSPFNKLSRATELVLNDDYFEQKDRIRSDMQDSLSEIDKISMELEEKEYDKLMKNLSFVRVLIALHAISIIFMLGMTTRLGIHPILKAADSIRSDSPIPEIGAREFRYLALAYNRMYSKNKTSMERLNFQVCHDELTGAYNRAGYDVFMENIDLATTYMLMLDVDDFKGVNDTYGHETGDKILIKLVRVLQSVFRDDDCICRIGGDEFVIFMVHSAGMQHRLIESKITQINDEMGNTDDGLPAVSISVGIVNGKGVTDRTQLFEKADEALYDAKKQGKHTFSFSS